MKVVPKFLDENTKLRKENQQLHTSNQLLNNQIKQHNEIYQKLELQANQSLMHVVELPAKQLSNHSDTMQRLQDEAVVTELKNLLQHYEERIANTIASIQEPIVLHGKNLTKHRITRSLRIQVLTTERWLSFKQIRTALGISRNNQTLRDLIHDLVYDGYLKTWHAGMQGPEQRYQMKQMLVPIV